MRGTQGALIVASTLQIIVGFSGLWRNVTRLVSFHPVYARCCLPFFVVVDLLKFIVPHVRFLSPLAAVPLVALSGFGLYEFGFPGVTIYHFMKI